MKRKAHGTQKPRHIKRIVEVARDTPNGYKPYPFGVSHRATWQFGDSPAQAINQGFPKLKIGISVIPFVQFGIF